MWTEWSSRHRFARLVGIVVLSVLVIPFGAALADCPIEEWTLDQATALVWADETGDGIGGSAALPGTGGDEDGIGGSGIFGTVTGFGSVCVNGRRVLYEDSVVVSVDAAVMDLSELVVGQVVRIETVIRKDEIHARSIDIQHELQGPVTGIGDDVLEVMGERVDPGGALDDFEGEIKIGTRIALSGLRRPDEKLVVSRIDLAPDNGVDLVRGELVPGEAGDLRIGAVSLRVGTVDLGIHSDVGRGRNRQLVRGWWNAGTRKLEVVRAESSPISPRLDRGIDIEGYAAETSETGFRVAGLRFVIEGGSEGGGFREGDRVRVRGVREGSDGDFRVISSSPVPEQRLLRSLDLQWRMIRPESGEPPRIDRLPRPPDPDRIRPERIRPPERPDRPEPHRDRLRRRRPDAMN